MNEKFYLNEVLEQIKAGTKIDGKDGVLAPLIKDRSGSGGRAGVASG